MAPIRRATPEDAARLSRLAATTFRDAFEVDNSSDDMERYVASAFTPTRQAAEIADAAGIVLLAEDHSTGSPELIGYAHLVSGAAPPAIHGAAPVELRRLYVAREWHGRGVAHELMASCLAAARAIGAQTMWLGVWERNARALAFYRKNGFEQVGEHTFLLGNDRQTDWLMERPVAGSAHG